MLPEQILTCALDIGEQMLLSGAEIGRVEDSIRLICSAYGCSRTDVFTITSSIVVSIEDSGRKFYTQSRRITGGKTDLARLDRLNTLSRHICRETPNWDFVQSRLARIVSAPAYPVWLEILASAMIAGAFAIFFGGTLADGFVACLLGAMLRIVTNLLQRAKMNQILINVAATFLVSSLAILSVKIGLGSDANEIIIGNIMLLIPGIALTNSLRDMISGDTMAGMLRFMEACILALAIAAGYILASMVMGGVRV
jgi:uncharacterized membrane protein YjjP (DUF1212 family)